jgi:hypothetical protein
VVVSLHFVCAQMNFCIHLNVYQAEPLGLRTYQAGISKMDQSTPVSQVLICQTNLSLKTEAQGA